jgi:hypothetical protein
MAIQNGDGPNHDLPGGVVSGITVRDTTVTLNPAAGFGIAISTDFDSVAKPMRDIRFDNLIIDKPGEIAFAVFSNKPVAPDGPGAIQNVTWRGGAVRGRADGTLPAITVQRLRGGRFERLRLNAGADLPAVVVGTATFPRAGAVDCRHVSILDVTVAGVRAGRIGAEIDAASACAWTRGGIAEASAAGPAAAAIRITAKAARCAVRGADLGRATVPFDLAADAGCRIGASFGGSRRSPAQLGSATAAPSLTSNLRVTAAEPATLRTATGGATGALLAIGWSGAAAVTVADGPANGNLRLAGDLALDSDQDALLLVRRDASQWSELARASNA